MLRPIIDSVLLILYLGIHLTYFPVTSYFLRKISWPTITALIAARNRFPRVITVNTTATPLFFYLLYRGCNLMQNISFGTYYFHFFGTALGWSRDSLKICGLLFDDWIGPHWEAGLVDKCVGFRDGIHATGSLPELFTYHVVDFATLQFSEWPATVGDLLFELPGTLLGIFWGFVASSHLLPQYHRV
jgi:hypothetical protein